MDAMTGHAPQPAKLQILCNGQAGEEAPALRNVADAEPGDLSRRAAVKRLAGEYNRSRRRRNYACERLQEGRFARAIASKKGGDFIFARRDTHTVEDMALPVIGVHI